MHWTGFPQRKTRNALFFAAQAMKGKGHDIDGVNGKGDGNGMLPHANCIVMDPMMQAEGLAKEDIARVSESNPAGFVWLRRVSWRCLHSRASGASSSTLEGCKEEGHGRTRTLR